MNYNYIKNKCGINMICRLILSLSVTDDLKNSNNSDKNFLTYNSASLFQGIIMENISTDYADILHYSQVHPYSQYTYNDGHLLKWVISVTTQEAYENIILPISAISKFCIKHKKLWLDVTDRQIETTDYNKLIDKYYLKHCSNRYITLKFLTPASFKSNGKYVIFPTAKLILNGILNKYNSFASDTTLDDDGLLQFIADNTEIVEYDLKSRKFHLEGISIPSFIGTVKLKISGNNDFICLVNMLLRYGEYTGAGIKNSIGMGAYKIIDQKGDLK